MNVALFKRLNLDRCVVHSSILQGCVPLFVSSNFLSNLPLSSHSTTLTFQASTRYNVMDAMLETYVDIIEIAFFLMFYSIIHGWAMEIGAKRLERQRTIPAIAAVSNWGEANRAET